MSPTYSKLSGAAVAVDLRKSAENVEKCFVGTSSRCTYNHKLVQLMVWLFDNRTKHLEKSVLMRMKKMHKLDVGQAKEKMEEIIQKTKKKEEKEKEEEKKGKKKDDRNHLRMLCYELLSKVRPQRKGKPHNSPINIEGKNAISYFVIRDYMSSKFNEVWVDKDSAEEYIRSSNSKQKIKKSDIIDGKVLVSTQQSQSQYDGIRSAVVSLYKLTHIQIPNEFSREMTGYIAGLQQTGIEEKQKLGLKLSEGKKPITREGYEFLAKTLFYSDKKEDIFAHLFLVLDW